MAPPKRGGKVEKRETPSTIRRRTNAKRSRRQLKAKRSAEKPSWTESLRRRYIEQDQAKQGKQVDKRPWQVRQKDAKKARELAQVRRRRGQVPPEEEAAASSDDDDEDAAEEEEEDIDFGEELEAGAKDGIEVQDDIDEDKMQRLNERNPLELQAFLKGLPQDVEESDLVAYLGRFGTVDKVFIVKHKLTGMPTGTAFVHFKDESAANGLFDTAKNNSLELASEQRGDQRAATEGLSRHKAKELLHKLKHQQTVSRDPFIFYGQTRVTVHKPMSRTDAQEFIGSMHKGGKKSKKTPTGQDDPRNLFLLREGLVEAGTPAAKGLSPHHLQMLMRDYEERKQQVRNVNFFVSKTRLSIRNLPRDFDTAKLRKMFIAKAKEFYKKNKTALDKSKWGKHGPVKQARVLVDAKGQSKRFGFIEMIDHDVALFCLRMINNNPEIFGPHARPVVNFAIENYTALQKLDRIRAQRKQREEANQSLLGHDGGDGDEQPKSYREMAMKAREEIQKRAKATAEAGGPRKKKKAGKKGGKKGGGGRPLSLQSLRNNTTSCKTQ
eukprot:CAMPEP_0174831266 /NCGR_PEP_ID=MMETSP1114-20130205/2997_1 /TAXON_ID=312471 /ORGANISM="Neobodo designis, Strain CCAP 1951/1" /LENGTH=550 /DNA_ID=CAMNT_0016065087 /DNA_START=49 /DNA_END=1699 /DNA_ORIENTATION=+